MKGEQCELAESDPCPLQVHNGHDCTLAYYMNCGPDIEPSPSVCSSRAGGLSSCWHALALKGVVITVYSGQVM